MPFEGFPEEATVFLAELADNNDRKWFTAHRQRYMVCAEGPAKALLAAITPELSDLIGQPVGGKIFRIHRDVRFSKDKTPYNTHIRMLFHALETRKGECGAQPAFYFSLEPDKVITGAGCMEFPKTTLADYRAAVDDAKNGAALVALLAKYRDTEGYRMNEPALKRLPAGYPADHPRGSLLRHKGLTIWHEDLLPAASAKATSLKALMQHYKKLKPVYDWLDNL